MRNIHNKIKTKSENTNYNSYKKFANNLDQLRGVLNFNLNNILFRIMN